MDHRLREMPVLRCGIEFLCHAYGGATASVSTVVTRQEKINVKASRYLDRIIKTIGAIGGCWNDTVRYDTPEYQFWIYYGSVLRVDKRTGEKQYTCVTATSRMPDKEKVASVLLLLHDNPKIFETWRTQALLLRD